MGLLIAFTIIFFILAAVVLYSIYVTNRVKSEQEMHIAALNNPYRIILDGNDKYRIQHYEFDNREEAGWRWMNTTELFSDAEEAKQRYCVLMAEFRYRCEEEDSKINRNEMLSVNDVRIHKILDMSDTIELIDQILKKLRDDSDYKTTNIKKHKSKAKVEEVEVKKSVRRRKKTDD